jgi:UDP-N-acetylglucosamine:LPS N-acetylglucosamine transferase
MAARGAAMTMEEADLTPERLAMLIKGLLNDRTSIKTMASAARGLARRGASARLLQECRAVLDQAI